MAINLLAQLGLPFLVEMIGGVLRNVAHPTAQTTADALDSLQDTIKTGGLSSQDLTEANRHIEELAKLKAEEQAKLSQQVNESLRAEIKSDDKFVRRMRPTFGYLMALTWAAQMFGVAYIMIFRTGEAILVIQALESLGTIWAVALSVLGIYVYKRSEDKKTTTRYVYMPMSGEENTEPVNNVQPSKEKRPTAKLSSYNE